MSKDEKRIELPVKTVDIVEKILGHNQEGQGLKILCLDQMFRRLTIILAQLKAENNLEKLEIRQLSYSLYHSKKLTKTIYNNLINTI